MDEYKFDISDRSSRNSCFCSGTGAQACGQRGAGVSCQSVRTDPGAFVGDPLYIGVVPVDTGAVYLVAGQDGEAQWKRLL
jgi:hypothetical protein